MLKKIRRTNLSRRKYADIEPELVKLYQDGVRLKDISEKYSINSGTLIGILRRLGVFEKKRNDWSHEEITIIRDRYPTASKDEMLELLPNRKW